MTERWVSIDEIAAHLGVRRESLYRWIEGRGLPAAKVGKLWKFKLSEVDAWMRDQNAVKRPGASPSAQGRVQLRAHIEPERSVLIIDDDASVRENLRDFFSDQGFGVLAASDGVEALALLRTTRPAPVLIILDLGMPKMDGWRFREIQASDPNFSAIPTIVVTGDPRAQVHGAIALRKPLRLEQVASAMERLLATTDDTRLSTSP